MARPVIALIIGSGKHFQGRENRRENRHFLFRDRLILQRKISGFEIVPCAILRMIRLFVKISHLRSAPLYREQYPRGEDIHTKNIKVARDAKSRLRFHIKIETAHYTKDLFSISRLLWDDNNKPQVRGCNKWYYFYGVFQIRKKYLYYIELLGIPAFPN